jgi:porin
MQVYQHTAITPNVQLLVNPALNPQEDQIWVIGLRALISF